MKILLDIILGLGYNQGRTTERDKTMLSKVIFYTVILIACLALGEGMMSGVRKSVNQMKEVSLKLTKEQVHAE